MQTNKEPDTVLICDGLRTRTRPSLKQKLSLPASATTSAAADGSGAVRWQPRATVAVPPRNCGVII